MQRSSSYFVLLVLVFLLTACGGRGAIDVGGTWNGTLTGSGGSAPFSMTLTQSGTNVTGTFGFTGSPTISVSGVIANNLVTVGAQDQSGSIQINGAVDGNTMTGTMTLTVGGQTGTGNFTATR